MFGVVMRFGFGYLILSNIFLTVSKSVLPNFPATRTTRFASIVASFAQRIFEGLGRFVGAGLVMSTSCSQSAGLVVIIMTQSSPVF